MGTCATTKKPIRRFASGGALDTALNIGMPFEPRQPAINPLQNQLNALDQKIAMGNAMDGLSNTERYQLANPTNAPYKPGAVGSGTSADVSMQRQQTGILQNLRQGIASQMPTTQEARWIGGGTGADTLYPGTRAFADGGVVGLMKRRKQQIDEAANYDTPNETIEKNPPSAGAKPSAGSQADDYAAQAAKIEAEQLAATKARMTQPKKKGFFGFANGGVVQPNMYLGEQIRASRPPNLLNAAGEVVDSLPYAAAQFVPGLNVPLGGAAMAVHTAQGRAEELPLDAISMIPGGKGVRLAKGVKLAAQQAVGQLGRASNTVQALGAADAFGSPAYANGGKIEGPGTPTSDSIAARVRQTGEPIQVSTGERIVSAAQEKVLQKIASGLGFDSLDALLESWTGKPVGPTIKGGKLAASSGIKLDPNRDYSIPADMQAEAATAQANKVAYVEPPSKPIDRKAQFSQPDVSMLAADPKGYEQARKQLAPDAPSAREVPTLARMTTQPIAQGLQERTFGARSPQATSLDPAQSNTAEPAPDQQMAGSMTMRGKTVSIPTDMNYTDVAGNPTNDWTKTDRYAQAMQVNERLSNLARKMERERYGRDMQADITNPKVIALAQANLDRMNQEDESQQQAISGGLDNRMKQNQLARSDQEQQMIARLNDPNLTMDQRLALRSDWLAMQGKNPNEHRYITLPNRKTYNDTGQITGEEAGGIFDAATGQTVGGGKSQTPDYATFEKAYLAKRPGTNPKQIKADYEALHGAR